MLEMIFELLGISRRNQGQRPQRKIGKKRSPVSKKKNQGGGMNFSTYTSQKKPAKKQLSFHGKQGGPSKKQFRGKANNYQKPRGRDAFTDSGGKRLTVYHGTKDISAVKSIRRDGWQIGSGNGHGDGIYFSTDYNEAKAYAGSSGVVIKCQVFPGKSTTWNNSLEKQYQKWCSNKKILPDSSAKTAFLLKHGYKTLRAGTILVVLKPQFNNHTAWRQKVKEIQVCSVHNPDSKKRINA
jgi:hypothetical protein